MDRRTERQEIVRTQECGAKSRIKLAIVYRRIDELKADPANPRRHSKKQIRQIGHSLKAFDFIVPVLIDRDDNIIAGHGRVLAGREAPSTWDLQIDGKRDGLSDTRRYA